MAILKTLTIIFNFGCTNFICRPMYHNNVNKIMDWRDYKKFRKFPNNAKSILNQY